jgi:hypothetical protein
MAILQPSGGASYSTFLSPLIHCHHQSNPNTFAWHAATSLVALGHIAAVDGQMNQAQGLAFIWEGTWITPEHNTKKWVSRD